MKPGDRVRVAPASGWARTFGDAIGTVQDVSDTDRLGWVHFPGVGHAQGWAWSNFDVVESAQSDVLEMAECGCSDDG